MSRTIAVGVAPAVGPRIEPLVHLGRRNVMKPPTRKRDHDEHASRSPARAHCRIYRNLRWGWLLGILIVGAEVSYVERVNGQLPPQPLSPDQFPPFAVLKDAVRWAGDELLQLALSARKDTSVRQRPPRQLIEYKLASLMVQAVSHSTEHRTQISAIITQLGLEPPAMSGWQYMEEIGELQELGAGAEGAS